MLIRKNSSNWRGGNLFYNSPPNQPRAAVTIRNIQPLWCLARPSRIELYLKIASLSIPARSSCHHQFPLSLRLQPQLLLCFAISCWWESSKDCTFVHQTLISRLFWSAGWLASLSWQPSINSWLGLPRVCYLQPWICNKPFILCILLQRGEDIPGSAMQPAFLISGKGDCFEKGDAELSQERSPNWLKVTKEWVSQHSSLSMPIQGRGVVLSYSWSKYKM